MTEPMTRERLLEALDAAGDRIVELESVALNNAIGYEEEAKELRACIVGFVQWVADLQSGMYINCVYCGHRYGPNHAVPVAMADVLREHIESCPRHPVSALKVRNKALAGALREYLEVTEEVDGAAPVFDPLEPPELQARLDAAYGAARALLGDGGAS